LTPQLTQNEVEFPEKIRFLFEPAPAKVLYGGRDGIKSWSMAQALLIMGTQYRLRWLCARETMQSLAESVHQLLEEQIVRLGLQDGYRIEKSRIVGTRLQTAGMYGRPMASPGFTEFVFAGLHHNVNQIKSYEGLDGIWVEEAVDVSANSWDTVVPTIRKEGAEIWISFNPKLATDQTYVRWVLNPPPGTVVVRTGYQDNLWLSEISKARIAHLKETDEAKYLCIYGGECDSAVEGAIFGPHMKAATAEKRIGNVPYNRAYPVHTVWDLGFGDVTSIWFVQVYDGWHNFIDHEEANATEIADWVIRLQNKQYLYGTDWLPHDGVDTIIHKKLAGGGDRKMSIEMLMREAGRKPRIVPKMLITDQINAARTLFPTCRFDEQKCADGIQALRHYQWPALSAEGVSQRKPLHNWASHASSAFCGAAVAVRQPKAELPQQPRPRSAPPSPWS
jgi:phage terminase large subunit